MDRVRWGQTRFLLFISLPVSHSPKVCQSGRQATIEVADTTLRDDREVKVPLYGAHGIPEVWLIDVESKAVQVFRAFEGGQYRNAFTVRGAGSLAPVLLADVRIDVSQLL
jgi:Uma2 family endonuclease